MVAESRFGLGHASRFIPEHAPEREAIPDGAEARYQAICEVDATAAERLRLCAIIDPIWVVAWAQAREPCLVPTRLHTRQSHLSVPVANAPNIDTDQMQQRYVLTRAQTIMADARVRFKLPRPVRGEQATSRQAASQHAIATLTSLHCQTSGDHQMGKSAVLGERC